jgi:hypothetical protein
MTRRIVCSLCGDRHLDAECPRGERAKTDQRKMRAQRNGIRGRRGPDRKAKP